MTDALSYAASGILAVAFIFAVVSGVRMAFRARERPDGPLAVLVGFIAAGSVSALVAALL
jgi:hypothetical protein